MVLTYVITLRHVLASRDHWNWLRWMFCLCHTSVCVFTILLFDYNYPFVVLSLTLHVGSDFKRGPNRGLNKTFCPSMSPWRTNMWSNLVVEAFCCEIVFYEMQFYEILWNVLCFMTWSNHQMVSPPSLPTLRSDVSTTVVFIHEMMGYFGHIK